MAAAAIAARTTRTSLGLGSSRVCRFNILSYPVISLISCHILDILSYLDISIISLIIESYPYMEISTVDTTSQCQIHGPIYEFILSYPYMEISTVDTTDQCQIHVLIYELILM